MIGKKQIRGKRAFSRTTSFQENRCCYLVFVQKQIAADIIPTNLLEKFDKYILYYSGLPI